MQLELTCCQFLDACTVGVLIQREDCLALKEEDQYEHGCCCKLTVSLVVECEKEVLLSVRYKLITAFHHM